METTPDPDAAVTGLPSEDEPEAPPLGGPEDDDTPTTGPDAMPGIVTDGDPPGVG